MNKFSLFIMLLYASLCSMCMHAQEESRQIISIEEMFSLADLHSKSLRPFIIGINEANEAVKAAKMTRLPEIEASLQVSYLGDGYIFDRDFSNGLNAPMPHFGNNFSLEISQIIYAGGAISNGIAISQLQEVNAELNLDVNRNNLRFLLVGYYLDLFRQQNMFKVYEKNIEQTKLLLKDIRAKGNEGIVLKNDITRYELLLSTLELANIQIKNTLCILNSNLITSLGLPAHIQIEPDTSILSQVLPLENSEYWISSAFENSPVLKQTSLSVLIKQHEDKITRSERLPTVALVAANHLNGPITIEVPAINKNFNYWYIGVGINYNFSSLYKTQQSVNRNKFSIQRSKELHEDVKEQTELSVKADYIRYLEAYEQLKTQLMGVELANENYRVISNRYQHGMALITDMLDASTSKLNAELQLVNARVNIIFNYYKLKKTTGNL